MLKVGDTIKMRKAIGGIDITDQLMKIDAINDGIMTITSPIGIWFLDEEAFKKHFIRMRNWTPWVWNEDAIYEYRTDNEKYVEVRAHGYKTRAACNTDIDKFDLVVGLNMCLARLVVKMRVKMYVK